MPDTGAMPINPANVPSTRFFAGIGLSATMRVLDVGCGNGDLTRMAAALVGPGGEVVGVDSSATALAAARAAPSDTRSASVRYELADLRGPLPALGRFDAIIGRRVLMYLPDAAATLTRLADFAKPGTVLAFQEHARAALPAGAGDLPVHRRCYGMAWNTVAAEQGDVTLGYRLVDLVRAAGFAVEQGYSEGIVIQPWQESFLPTLIRMMLPRMIERGVVRPHEVDPESLAEQLDDERHTAGGTILWDVAFLVSGRFGSRA